MRCPRCGWRFGPSKETSKEITTNYPKAFRPWTPDDDRTLAAFVERKAPLLEMVQTLGRQPNAVRRRIILLGLDHQEAAPPPEAKDYLET